MSFLAGAVSRRRRVTARRCFLIIFEVGASGGLGAAATRLGSFLYVSGRCYTRCAVQWIAIGSHRCADADAFSMLASVLQAASLRFSGKLREPCGAGARTRTSHNLPGKDVPEGGGSDPELEEEGRQRARRRRPREAPSERGVGLGRRRGRRRVLGQPGGVVGGRGYGFAFPRREGGRTL